MAGPTSIIHSGENLDQYVKHFVTNVKANAAKSAYEAAQIIGEQIVQDAREQLVADGHVDTGKLLNSIHYEVDDLGGGTSGVILNIKADATNDNGEQYGGYIEALDPFAGPAIVSEWTQFGVEYHRIFTDLMQNS